MRRTRRQRRRRGRADSGQAESTTGSASDEPRGADGNAGDDGAEDGERRQRGPQHRASVRQCTAGAAPQHSLKPHP
eukprot:13285702-Alexandrium_andersonii.AAC.2